MLEADTGTPVTVAGAPLAIAEQPNAAPVADAGPDQNVATGALVMLDGSASTDPTET